MTNPNKDMHYLENLLRARLPDARLELTSPGRKGGVWWLDIIAVNQELTVEWSSSRGFGLSTPSDHDYGTPPSEMFDDADEVASRVVELITRKERPHSRREMLLQRLREHRELSQDSLARLLAVSQASISKLERRSDVRVATLRSFIEALGGRLDLVAQFETESIHLKFPGDQGGIAGSGSVAPNKGTSGETSLGFGSSELRATVWGEERSNHTVALSSEWPVNPERVTSSRITSGQTKARRAA
jgi:DNA-binding XRE family transcriptional regulator